MRRRVPGLIIGSPIPESLVRGRDCGASGRGPLDGDPGHQHEHPAERLSHREQLAENRRGDCHAEEGLRAHAS